jgi:hypothetical protein
MKMQMMRFIKLMETRKALWLKDMPQQDRVLLFKKEIR